MAYLIGELVAVPPWAVLLAGFVLPALESSTLLGLVVPGELAVLLGGVLAHEGRLSLISVMAATVVGAVTGDSLGYLLGARFGPALFARSDHADRRLHRAQAFIRQFGGLAVLLGRWAVFVGTLVPSIAGASHIPYRRFVAYSAAGGATWGVGIAGIGYLVGVAYRGADEALGLAGVGAAIVLVVGVLLGTHRLSRRGTAPGPDRQLARRLREPIAPREE
jgi:membrane-associated protein